MPVGADLVIAGPVMQAAGNTAGNLADDAVAQFADDAARIIDEIPGSPGTTLTDASTSRFLRLVPEDWVGQSRAFKTYPGEDGLSVFEGVSPEDVLSELPGNRVPNTTVTIPRDGLPPGTQVVPTDAPGLSQRLSEAHRILVRPEGWSVDKFAKVIKTLVGWE